MDQSYDCVHHDNQCKLVKKIAKHHIILVTRVFEFHGNLDFDKSLSYPKECPEVLYGVHCPIQKQNATFVVVFIFYVTEIILAFELRYSGVSIILLQCLLLFTAFIVLRRNIWCTPLSISVCCCGVVRMELSTVSISYLPDRSERINNRILW